MTSIQTVIFCILIYLALNIFFLKKYHINQRTFESFSVGNRGFGWILFSFAYVGYWYVGSIYISWFNTAAQVGIFSQYLLIYSMASPIILYFMAKPVWIWGKIYHLETQADIIGLRYGNAKFKALFSILTFLFWFPWLILEMRTIGYTISIATNSFIDFNLGMIIICLFVIIYTFYGGVRASAIGSVIQVSIFAGLGLICFSFLIWKTYGNVHSLFSMLEKSYPALLTLRPEYGGFYWASVIITSTLGAFSLPGMFKLMYTADSPRTIKKTACIAPLVVIPTVFVVLLLGMGGQTLSEFPIGSESSLFWIAKTYGGNFILGLVAVFALSASMSTISGVINTAAVMISKDWINGLFLSISREQLLRNAKGATIAVGIFSLYIASIEIPNLLIITLLMYDCVVQAFIPLFIGQYWKRSNLIGASLGMIIGILIAIYGNIVPESIIWAKGWSAGMIGLMANLVIHFVCGVLIGKQDHVDKLFDDLENNNYNKKN